MGERRMNTMKSIIKLCAISSMMWILSCTPKPVEKEEIEQLRYIDTLIGTVSSVEDATNTVLFRSFSTVKPAQTSVYIVKGNSSLAVIKLTGQSNRYFVAAEKMNGELTEGDAVYKRDVNPNYKPKADEQKPAILNDEAGPQDNIIQEKPSHTETPFTKTPVDF